MMKPLYLMCVLFVVSLALVACQPVHPEEPMAAMEPAAPQAVTPPQTDEEKIASIAGAGPSVITDDASVLDWPAEPGAKPVQLREGTNGWVCRPDDPITPVLDSRCFHPSYLKLLGVAFGPDREAANSFGVAYMLNGGNAADNDDPAVITPTVGTEWQQDPPHLMITSPTMWDMSVVTNDHHNGGPWIMFHGSPAEHMMVPIGQLPEAVPADDKIGNAMSAGPASISANATIMDWPAEAGGDLVELRAGNNGWTCLPDDPSTPVGDDPMCVDEVWMGWLEAFMSGTEPQIDHIGIAYMLQGGPVADNDDPMATEPPAGQEWQMDPPPIMILSPLGWDPELFPTDVASGGPWIMFGGTPYEHLMFPIVNRSEGN
jgi:hypothetical protein